MKNRLTANIGLKIASVFCGVILWLVVTSIEDPSIPHTYYNIPVKLLNTEMITESGQVYEVLEGTDVIDRVTVRAPRTVISALSEENIIATADVNELSSLDTISIKLSTDIERNSINSITGSIDTVKLKIEDQKTKALSLKTQTSGQVAEGYMIGEITTDQNLVRITGPDSIVSQVTKAVIDVDVTGFTSDIVTNAEIKLYDSEDNEISSGRLAQNIRTVGVQIGILQTLEVPVNFTVSGRPATGYRITGEVESSVQTVLIAGKSNAIRNLTSIDVPEDVLDVTDMTEPFETEIDIRQYLPDNVFLADSAQAKINVSVSIEPEISKRLEIRGERVRITNLPEGYDASISDLGESFIIEVVGLTGQVAGLQASGISGVVDIEAWMQNNGMTEPEPGYYTVEVDFNLPEGVYLRPPVTVMLHISELEEE